MRAAINGFGRIGRCLVRALAESGRDDVEIVAVNDFSPVELAAHLLSYDSTHGVFAAEVAAEDGALIVNGKAIRHTSIIAAADLPWRELQVDVVLECTGRYTSREKAAAHLDAGAKKVVVSAPAKGADATVVYGVNEAAIPEGARIISCASCTTNCLAPLAKVMQDEIGVVAGWLNTIHAFTNDQRVLDGGHADWRRARAAGESMIPTKTGAAAAIGLVIPELDGKLDGIAVRVPTKNVSLVDFTFLAARDVSADEINAAMRAAADGAMRGVVAVNDLPLVSTDFNHNPASCIFDATQTKVTQSRLAKTLAWYDNEWGFANRMLDVAAAVAAD